MILLIFFVILFCNSAIFTSSKQETEQESNRQGVYESDLMYVLRMERKGTVPECDEYKNKKAAALDLTARTLLARQEDLSHTVTSSVNGHVENTSAFLKDLNDITSSTNNLSSSNAQLTNDQLKKYQDNQRKLLAHIIETFHQQNCIINEQRKKIRKKNTSQEKDTSSNVSGSDDDDPTKFAQRSLNMRRHIPKTK